MRRFGKLIVAAGVGVLAIVAVTGVLAGPGGLLRKQADDSPPLAELEEVAAPDEPVATPDSGRDDSGKQEIVGDVIACAVGEDTRFRFEHGDGEFDVTGFLESLGDGTVAVMGPDGVVDAAIHTDIRVKDAPRAGEPARVRGMLAADGGRLALEIKSACDRSATAGVCDRGPGEPGDLRLEIEDGEVDIQRGGVLSYAEGMLEVETGIGPLMVIMDAGTEVDGDLSLATEVRVKGTMMDGSSVLADEVKALCPEAAHNAGAADDDDREDGRHGRGHNDDDDDDDDEGRGNGRDVEDED